MQRGGRHGSFERAHKRARASTVFVVQVENVLRAVLVTTLLGRVLGGQRCEVGARGVSGHGGTVRVLMLILGQTRANDKLGRLSVDVQRDRNDIVGSSRVERHERGR